VRAGPNGLSFYSFNNPPILPRPGAHDMKHRDEYPPGRAVAGCENAAAAFVTPAPDDLTRALHASVAFIGSQTRAWFARLDVAAAVGNSGATCDAVVAALGARPGDVALLICRLLEWAAAEEPQLLTATGDGAARVYRVAPAGQLLGSGGVQSLRFWTASTHDWARALDRRLERFLAPLERGGSDDDDDNAGEVEVRDEVNVDLYATMEADNVRRGNFDAAMEEFSAVGLRALADGLGEGEERALAAEFSTCTHICDVGGGTGTLLRTLLRRHSAVTTGTLLESAAGARAEATRAFAEKEEEEEKTRDEKRFAAISYDALGEEKRDRFTGSADDASRVRSCDCVVVKGVASDFGDAAVATLFANLRSDFGEAKCFVIDHFLRTRGERTDAARKAERFKHRMDALMFGLFDENAKQRTVAETAALMQGGAEGEKKGVRLFRTRATQDVLVASL
jgi:hypothetical protein